MCNKVQDEPFSNDILLESESDSPYHFVVDSRTKTESMESSSNHRLGEVTLSFHMEDQSHHQMIVEEDLRCIDLSHLLTLKFNLSPSHAWSIVEQLQNLGIERSLEDHEEVLQVYYAWDSESVGNRFVFRQDFEKYKFFRSSQVMDHGCQLEYIPKSASLAKDITVQNMLHTNDPVPTVQNYLWLKDRGWHSWKKFFFRVQENVLNISLSAGERKPQQLHPFVDLQNFDIYMPIDGVCCKAPTAFYFCIKPKQRVVRTKSDLKWFCCDNQHQRYCWIVALRVAKYGKKLQENYRELRTRYGDSTFSNNIETNEGILLSYSTSVKTVAKDLTRKFDRLVDSPEEAKAIATAKTHEWKRRLPVLHGIQSYHQGSHKFGIHIVQPWFYSDMSREDTAQLLSKYGTVDGVFLVRDSRRNPNTFVLSYMYNQKVYHTQIVPVEDETQVCFSLDGGRTKFYDLLQLIEFYQLNLGCLPTKLTHFLVHHPK
ncbi:growth factor receptor-bound protein 14-like isoform X2 [Limulus polyphemus]|uniref:Growth factor receptor-bound protein 14-like isoform X2 n=1 Tax=Limulus polyphemus TaxID=6850 RepID=A0ABM1TKY9_LIMPO|nr:growth factor receptor-bound protein 14-like isoform X2 [Limulus polyphemus]